MAMTRYQFLAALHERLKPEVYLEIGVQTGASLVLAERAGIAVGIDPVLSAMQWENKRPNQRLYEQTSDDYFGCDHCERPAPDLAFIDGSHLAEDALRDFLHIQALAGPRVVTVFDDVLPYSDAIAGRQMVGGDWTGDVWKLVPVLCSPTHATLGFSFTVATEGIGMMIAVSNRWRGMDVEYAHLAADLIEPRTVPDHVLKRDGALEPDAALDMMSSLLDQIGG